METLEPYRVLFVDDDELAVKLARRVFEGDEDIVLQATTSANEALSAPDPSLDLIVADNRMPEMPGLLLLARMAEVVPDAMRVMLTAFPDISVAMEGINKGLLHRLVIKPWDADDMRSTLREDLRKKRINDRNRQISDRLREWFEDLVDGERRAVAGGVGGVLKGINAMLSHGADELHDQHASLLVEVNMLPSSANRVRAIARDMGEGVEIIQRSAAEIGGLTKRLIKPREPEAAGDRWDPNDAIRIAAELLRDRFPQGAPQLDLAALPLIDTAGSDILRITMHLLLNAAEATNPSLLDQVTVRTSSEGKSIRIEVANPGFTPVQTEDLFVPLRSKEDGRLGLGLSVCQALVEMAGGTIEVGSHKGWTISVVVLPVWSRSSHPPRG